MQKGGTSMNPKEKILRTELVSAGAALLCCLLLCIACFLLAGLPSAITCSFRKNLH